MAVTRPFAFNTGSTITGTIQVGNLAIGVDAYDYSEQPGGVVWWNGPDEELGYVIAHETPLGNQPNPLDIPAFLGFWRTEGLDESLFISLSEWVSEKDGDPQIFLTGDDAKLWLNNNGYWTSYDGGPSPTTTTTTTTTGVTTGDYLLLNSYSPALTNGSITFPDANLDNFSLDPNLIGQTGYEIYINQFDSLGNDMSTTLDLLIGRSGTFTLTQGVNSVTYSFTSDAFTYGSPYSNQYWWGDIHNPVQSPPNTIVLISSPSPSDCDSATPITITVT